MRVAVLVLAAAVACGVPNRALPPLRRTVRSADPSWMERTITDRRVNGVTLRIYDTGFIHTRGGAVSSERSWSSKVTLDVPVFLVRHPVQGALLFDAGLTAHHARLLNEGFLANLVARFEAPAGMDAVAQLKRDGVAPESVRWIVLSHVHLDHVGDLSQFPNATVVVSRLEWEGAKRRQAEKPDPRRFDPRQWERQLKLRLVDMDAQAPYGPFDHGLDLFSDGAVVFVDLPGHTPGSIGAWLNLDGGPVLLAGDAAWVVDNYMDLSLPHERAMEDPPAYRRSLEMIRAAQAALPRLVVFPGHDLTPRKLTDREDLPLAAPPPASAP